MYRLFGFLIFCAQLLVAETPVPRFEDFQADVDWHGPNVAVQLNSASERMFRTRLTDAAKEPPNFAGHYRFAGWGCGSICGAGAIVDLQTGAVYQPPLGGRGQGWDRWISCPAMFDGTGYKYRLDSRLMIVRCGSSFNEHGKNWPDVYYLLWEGTQFKELLHIRAGRPRSVSKGRS